MITRKLISVQRAGTLAVTGGLRTSPTDTLDALANLISFEHIIKNWCYRAALRLATLPDKHPLRKPVKLSYKSTVKKHKSPLHTLLKVLDTDRDKLGTKPVATHNHAQPKHIPFTVRVPPDKESSKREARRVSDEIQVFTDGSITDKKVGAAAILTRPGKAHRILHYHLGKSNEYTIYDAELAGITLGMQLIKTEKSARRKTTLGVDNQAAIAAVQNELSTPTHPLAKSILQTARQIKSDRGTKNYALTLRWTAGHVGIAGNELVDSEAKKAAKGQSSDPKSLPNMLRRKLKISPAAMKQNHSAQGIEKWKKKWAASPRGKRDHQLDPSSPSKKFLDAISNPKLPRQASSIISQLRISHVPLNAYLYRFKCVDKPQCPACGHPNETPEHFLMHCPAYAHERWALEKTLKCKPDLKTTLGKHEATIALHHFIKATHRFDPVNSPESGK
jgi:ribonuclease HI